MGTLAKNVREAEFQAAFERLARLSRVNFDMPGELRLPKPTLWQVQFRRYPSGRWVQALFMINEDGELEEVGRYIHWVTGLKMVKNTYHIVSSGASSPVELLNREFERAGYDPNWFRGVAL